MRRHIRASVVGTPIVMVGSASSTPCTSAWSSCATTRRRPARVLGVAFLYQAILVTAAWMAARVVDIPELGIREMIAFFPAIAIAQVLPISIGGIGVRESLFVVFLEALGMSNPEPKAVSLGILLYLLTLVASLPGALTFVTGAPVEESPTVSSSTA